MSNIVTTNVSDVPIKDKQLIIDPESGELYFDHGDVRVKLGGSDAPVSSVNGKTGEVVLDAEDVQAASKMEYVSLDEFNTGSSVSVELEGGKYYKLFNSTPPNNDYTITSVESTLQEIIIEIDTTEGGPDDPASWVWVGFPSTIMWLHTPEFTPGKWLVSIVNNIAVAAEVTV